MKRFLLIATLISIALYSQSGALSWGSYVLNADAIAERYCVNPTVPTCHGKCHVAKGELDERDEEGSLPPSQLSLETTVLFIVSSTTDVAPALNATISCPATFRSSPLAGHSGSVFHPPPRQV